VGTLQINTTTAPIRATDPITIKIIVVSESESPFGQFPREKNTEESVDSCAVTVHRCVLIKTFEYEML